MKKIIILFFLTTFSLNSQILSEKNRAVKINEILKNRFENVLPELMDNTGIDISVDPSGQFKYTSSLLETGGDVHVSSLISYKARTIDK